ncbi:MAG: efflux transporter outer membrane subunit [Bacteroidales bacterium]|nr:efflux transporter outer membrane subunit [Bacteroidales bacterium]
MRKFIYITISAVLLSGCHIYKKYERPEDINVANAYRTPEGMNNSPSTNNIGNLEWKDIYPDEKLQELINYGLLNNTNLLIAIEKVNEAKAALTSARLSFLPSISLTPEGGVSSFDGSAASWSYNASASASWEIDLFGKLLNSKRKAQVALLQNKEYQQAVRTQLIATIADYYFTLTALDKQLAIYTITEQSWAESVETIKAMKEGGMTNEAAVAQYEAYHASIAAAIPDVKAEIIKQENALATLLGDFPKSIDRNSIDSQKCDFPIEVGIPVELLSNRPDVKNAEYQLAAMYYNTNIARSSFYPQLSIGGSLGWTNAAGAAITNPGGLILSALASITQPIFNKGVNIAKLKIAKAQEEQAKLNFKQVLLDAGREVSDALAIYDAELKKESKRELQIEKLSNAVEYTKELLTLGSSTYLEVLDAQQSLLSAQLTKTEDQLKKLNSITSLYHALGGGREIEAND